MKIVSVVFGMLMLVTGAFAQVGDYCGVRRKSIPLLGSVEYKYRRTTGAAALEVTQLSGLGAGTMISRGLSEAVQAAVEPQEAAAVIAFLNSSQIVVGTVVSMTLVDGKTTLKVGDKSEVFSDKLIAGLTRVIEEKINSGDGGSARVECN